MILNTCTLIVDGNRENDPLSVVLLGWTVSLSDEGMRLRESALPEHLNSICRNTWGIFIRNRRCLEVRSII